MLFLAKSNIPPIKGNFLRDNFHEDLYVNEGIYENSDEEDIYENSDEELYETSDEEEEEENENPEEGEINETLDEEEIYENAEEIELYEKSEEKKILCKLNFIPMNPNSSIVQKFQNGIFPDHLKVSLIFS